MKIELKKSPDTPVYPYSLAIDLTHDVVHSKTAYEVPVKSKDGKHIITVFGFQTGSENPERLPNLAGALFGGLINVARLPNYAFVARAAKRVYPVYTIQSEVMVVTPNGPIFRHVELAKVREYLTDYLQDSKILGPEDKLHVRGIADDLSLSRPVFYLKSRKPGVSNFWAPVFISADKKTIFAYAANGKREVEVKGGSEVFALRYQVAKALIADNRLDECDELRIDRLFPDTWEQMKAGMSREGEIAVSSQTIEVYKDGDMFVALETREGGERFGLYTAETLEAVTAKVEADYARRGL
jgi:hypothetical protein